MIELRNGYWAVEVPPDAKNFRFGKSERLRNKLFYSTTIDYFAGAQVIELPPGTWEIVCMSKEATEEQAAIIVEPQGRGFKDYDKESIPSIYPYTSPFESFNSLLISKGCDLSNNYLILKKTA